MKVVTDKGRAAFVALDKPRDYEGKEKYEIVLILTDESAIQAIKKAAHEVVIETYGSADKVPEGFINPFKPAREWRNEEKIYNGFDVEGVALRFTSVSKPQIFDESRRVVEEPGFIYSGCFVRISATAKTYAVRGNKGVAFYVNAVQRVAHGEPLGGSYADDFDAVETKDEAIDAYF